MPTAVQDIVSRIDKPFDKLTSSNIIGISPRQFQRLMVSPTPGSLENNKKKLYDPEAIINIALSKGKTLMDIEKVLNLPGVDNVLDNDLDTKVTQTPLPKEPVVEKLLETVLNQSKQLQDVSFQMGRYQGEIDHLTEQIRLLMAPKEGEIIKRAPDAPQRPTATKKVSRHPRTTKAKRRVDKKKIEKHRLLWFKW